MPTTYFWRGFKFTAVWKGEEFAAYEATCYIAEHGGKKCCRRRQFRTHGGDEVVERMLRAWCLQGLLPSTRTAEDHMRLCDTTGAELPALEALDATATDCDKAKKRPRFG